MRHPRKSQPSCRTTVAFSGWVAPGHCAQQTSDCAEAFGVSTAVIFTPTEVHLLTEMEEVADFVAEVYSNDIGMDEVLLHLQAVNYSEETDRKIRAYLQARLRVSPHIKYVTKEEILVMQFPEAGRKALKFIDRR